MTKKEIKTLKQDDGVREILNRVLEKGGNSNLKIKQIIVKNDSKNQKMNDLEEWLKDITKGIIESGFKNSSLETENIGEYFSRRVNSEKKGNFINQNDEKLEILVDSWVQEVTEPIVKNIIENCGFYKEKWDWAAGVDGVFQQGVTWNTVKNKNLGKVTEENIGKVYKNKCGLKIGRGQSITWASYWPQEGSGPTLSTQGLRNKNVEWDRNIGNLLKKYSITVAKQLKESVGVESFVKNNVKNRFEKDWFESKNQPIKVWEKGINNISWKI